MGVYYANTGLNDFLLIDTSADILVQASAFSTLILNAMPRHLDAGGTNADAPSPQCKEDCCADPARVTWCEFVHARECVSSFPNRPCSHALPWKTSLNRERVACMLARARFPKSAPLPRISLEDVGRRQKIPWKMCLPPTLSLGRREFI